MSQKPSVSIIIATYNRDKYIKKAVSSALKQTYSNYEVVFVDDGSTDNTEKIINEFNSSKLNYIKKQHSGCWPSKNSGIENAKGDYIVFLDSDDFLSNDYIENGLNEIEKMPGYDYYYPTKLIIVNKKGKITNRIWRYIEYLPNERWKLLKLFLDSTIGGIPHTGAFIHKSVFKKNGLYDKRLFNFGDTAYVIKNAYNINFKLITELVSYYKRHHKKQICKNMKYRSKTVAELIEFIFKNYDYHDYIDKFNTSQPEPNKKIDFYNFCVGTFMKHSNNYEPYEEHFHLYAKKYLKKLRNLQKKDL